MISLVTQISYSFVYYRFVLFFSPICKACEVEDAIRTDITTFSNRRKSYWLHRQSHRIMLFHILHIENHILSKILYRITYFYENKNISNQKVLFSAKCNYCYIYHLERNLFQKYWKLKFYCM